MANRRVFYEGIANPRGDSNPLLSGESFIIEWLLGPAYLDVPWPSGNPPAPTDTPATFPATLPYRAQTTVFFSNPSNSPDTTVTVTLIVVPATNSGTTLASIGALTVLSAGHPVFFTGTFGGTVQVQVTNNGPALIHVSDSESEIVSSILIEGLFPEPPTPGAGGRRRWVGVTA